MTDNELDRRLHAWLATRDPGPVPVALKLAVARVPYDVRPPIRWLIADAIASRWAIPQTRTIHGLRLAVAIALLLVLATAAAMMAGSQGPLDLSWLRLAPGPQLPSDTENWARGRAPGSIHAFAVGGPGIVAVGDGEGGPAAWWSRDGRTWTAGGLARGLISDVAVGGPGFVAVGAAEDGAAVWTSDDGGG